jgi:uncharacterized Ntn-hydrolase superfamily protein
MTYSIVARDSQTGELGVAVQTGTFSAGTVVPWARAGVGAVATQAMGEVAHGWRIIDAMAEGVAAPAALEASLALDPASALRQVGAVDAAGRAAAFSGALCIDEAGHHCGDGYAVQANMMASKTVWPAMADAFERARGPLADRLLATLHAAQAAGGDARGCMSAALVVVEATPAEDPRGGVVVDLRVDAHDAPLDELRRVLDVRNAYRHNAAATDALVAGDIDTAAREIDAALALLPADENFRFLKAGVLIFSGHVDDGRALTRALVAERPTWATVIRSFAVKGLLPLPDDLDVESFIRA